MNTVADVLAFLEGLAPRYMKMDWDNVGLLCGSRTTEVTKVLVALDPFEHVCKEAADMGAQLIVTHHPLMFSGKTKPAPIPSTSTTKIATLIFHPPYPEKVGRKYKPR